MRTSGASGNGVRVALRLIVASLGVGMATVAVAVLPAQIAGAATHTVSNCSATGPGSLAAQVAAATPGTTVTFAPAVTACSPIVLTSTVTIGVNLTIDGPGATKLDISGGGAIEVFSVSSGVTATISGLTIEHGSADSGGGIYNEGTLNITNSTLSDNVALFGCFHGICGGAGGGIYNNDGTVNVTNSAISGNDSHEGDGIYNNDGTVNVTNSTLSGNTSSGFLGAGAGIYNNDGTLNVTNSTLSDNTILFEDTYGGGIGNNGGTLNVMNSTFSDNSAESGGGIGNEGGTAYVSDSTLSDNNAGIGGGIDNEGGTAYVSDSTLSDNTASYGAGIQNSYFAVGTVNVDNSTLDDNPGGGAAINNLDGGTANVENSTVYGGTYGIFNDGTANVEATILAANDGRDCAGNNPINDEGYNIGDDGSCPSTGTSTGDSLTLDASLGSLANNGGPTQTIALSGGPAVDVVPAADCPPTDQRGAPRTAPCDIGAYDTDFPSFSAVCATGTPYYLYATYSTGVFSGLFCVNANGDGTYTQYSPGLPGNQQTLTGTGHIRKNQGVTSIQAYMPTFQNLNLVGTTNGTSSSFGESGSGFPHLNGTFTLT